MSNLFNFIFLSTIGWGASLFLIKILLTSLSPTEIVLYRMLLGSITLIIISLLLKIKITQVKLLLKDGFIFAFFNMTLPIYLTSVAEKNISSALAAIINGLTPLLTFLIGYFTFFNKNKMNYLCLLSILLGLTGIIVINLDVKLTQFSLQNIFLLILVSLSYALAANYIKYGARTKDFLPLVLTATVMTTAMMFILKILQGSFLQWHVPHGWQQISALIWLGGVSSGICFYYYCQLIKNTNAVSASRITFLMVLTGIFLGVMILKENLDFYSLLGCILISISLILN